MSEQGPEFRLKKFIAQGLFEKASAVVPTKDILPVLKNFQVEVAEDNLSVVATDMELSVVCHTSVVSTDTPGTVVLPAKKVLEIIREAPDGDLLFEVADETLTISAGGARWILRLPSGDDYPPMPTLGEVSWESVDREKFLTALSSVYSAAATDMTRPSLMMVNVQGGKMTACDGVRFQQTSVEYPGDVQIPIGAVSDLVKLLRVSDVQEIGVGQTEFHLAFKVGQDAFLSAKLMATFPDVEALLLRPALMNTDEFSVVTGDLVSAVRRVRINADEDSMALILEISEDSCTVVSRDKFGNKASETISAVWAGKPRTVAVNHKYLLDMVSMHSGTSCQFFLGEDAKSRKAPVVLKDESTLGILNAMRVEWAG